MIVLKIEIQIQNVKRTKLKRPPPLLEGPNSTKKLEIKEKGNSKQKHVVLFK